MGPPPGEVVTEERPGPLGPPLPAAGQLRCSPADHPASPERWLRRIALTLILVALAIRIPLLRNMRLGGDETEHLHAAWAVAHGQVPYRDFWEMHTPLLYYLTAPAFRVMGEDLRIIYVSRGLMLLCLLLILLQLYRIARTCFDALTGLLAVLLFSYLLLHWIPAYEFRPDIPQTLLVLASLWRFMRAWERRSRADFLVAGALLGVAYWFLTKTLFPLFGLSLVFVLSAGLRRSRATLRQAVTSLLIFIGSFAVLAIIGGSLLWWAGALPNFLRWVVINPLYYPDRYHGFRRMEPEVHFVFLALALGGLVLNVTRMVKLKVVDEVRLSPLLAGSVTAVAYLFLMPGPYPQSALPFLPLAAMYGADALRRVLDRALAPTAADPSPPGEAEVPFIRSPARLACAGLTTLLLSGACVLPLRALLAEGSPFHDQWSERRQTIRYVLALTSPRDSIFDFSASYIFRPHATYYYRLGKGILMWLRSGFISEFEIMKDLRRNHCKLVIYPQSRIKLPPRLSRFLRSHYVSMGSRAEDEVLVAGKVLQPVDLVDHRATVSLIASTAYAVRSQGGTPRIYIDGHLYQSPLFLAQGDHQVQVEGAFQEIAIFYSRVLSVPPISPLDPGPSVAR